MDEEKTPGEVLESLALLEVCGDLSADLPGAGERLAVGKVAEGRKGLVALEFEHERSHEMEIGARSNERRENRLG